MDVDVIIQILGRVVFYLALAVIYTVIVEKNIPLGLGVAFVGTGLLILIAAIHKYGFPL